MNNLMLRENSIDTQSYMELRAEVGFKKLSFNQAEKALLHSLYVLGVYRAEHLLGMGRIVGDGSVICYIQDLIVHPEAQGMGVGSMLMNGLIDYVRGITEDGTQMMLALMCAKGREEFYQKHGFITRPTDELGPGMIRYIGA
jgi:GNAT superfamily N-acetyltransferase